MDLPLAQGGSPAPGGRAGNFPEDQRKFSAQGTEADEDQVVLEYSQHACEALMSIPIFWQVIVRQDLPPDQGGGGAQNIPPGPRSFPQPKGDV